MTRDYAKKKRPRTQARRGSGNSRKKKAPIPGWLWMLTGLLVGLFVAFLVWLQQQRLSEGRDSRPTPPPTSAPAEQRQRTPQSRPQPKPQPQPQPEASKPEEKPDDAIQFDFYEVLPSYQVSVPEQGEETTAPPPAVPATSVLLQVGSFRSSGDADTRRAELAMLGIVSRVQPATTAKGETWYRVMVGPYDSARELDRISRRLQDNNIEYLAVRKR